MRISMTGASCTGKTTLAEKLAEELDYPLIQEVARTIIRERGIISASELVNNPREAQAVQYKILLRQHLDENRCGGTFVSDRTYLDFIAYWRAYDIISEAGVDATTLFNSTCRMFTREMNDLIVYCPIEWDAEDDGFRLTNEELRHIVDDTIRREVAMLSVPVVRVKGAVGDRLSQVLEKVTELKD